MVAGLKIASMLAILSIQFFDIEAITTTTTTTTTTTSTTTAITTTVYKVGIQGVRFFTFLDVIYL